MRYEQHETIMETRAERIENGRATTDVEQILNDNMLHGRIEGDMRTFMDIVDHSERFGAQAEEYERKQLESQHKNAIGMAGEKGRSSKMLMNGMNMLGSPGYNFEGPSSTNKPKLIVGAKGNQSIAEKTQNSLERIEPETSALSLFKKKHRFGS